MILAHWVIAVPYDVPGQPLRDDDAVTTEPIEHGAFDLDNVFVRVRTDHERDYQGDDPSESVAGYVADWRDRPEALYAHLLLKDPVTHPSARHALDRLSRANDSSLSVGYWIRDERAGVRGRLDLFELAVLEQGCFPQCRMLDEREAERMLAGERLALTDVAPWRKSWDGDRSKFFVRPRLRPPRRSAVA